RIPAYHHINRIEQSLQITVLIKGRTQIRHDDIPHEHHSFVGKVNQHGIMRFSPSNRDQLELRPTDVYVCSFGDRYVLLVTKEILRGELLCEELLPEDLRPIGLLFERFLVVASPTKLGTRVQAAEVGLAADMVPVGVSNEHGCQRRQSWGIGLKSFVGTLCEI